MSILFTIDKTLAFPRKCRMLVENAIERSLETEGVRKDAEISVSIVNDENIRELNKKFRGIDRPTDVLSFPMYDSLEEIGGVQGGVILGDIVISLEKAQKQADEYGHGIDRELSFLTVHSMLHLFGYDHTEPEDEKEMFARQEEILKIL